MTEDYSKLKKENKRLKSKKESKKQKDFLKKFSAKLTAKKIAKSNQMQVHISNKPVESVLNDPNRFFTGELNKEKRSLYFS